jgi:hypothetical protein
MASRSHSKEFTLQHPKRTISELKQYRFEAVRRLISRKDPSCNGKKIPLWKAEQLVPSIDELRKRGPSPSEREAALKKRLRGDDYVGDAFRALLKKGIAEEWLEFRILDLLFHPMRRTRKRHPAADKRKLLRIVGDLEKAGRELRNFDMLFGFADAQQWPVPAHEVPLIVGGIGFCLRQAMQAPGWDGSSDAQVWVMINYIVIGARFQTGRCHYEHLATLVGAAIGNPEFSAEQLKMGIRRSDGRIFGNARLRK